MWLALLSHAQCLRKYFISLQRAYTKDAIENFSKYTSVVDTPDIVLAKINSVNQSDVCTLVFLSILLDDLFLLACTVFSCVCVCVCAYARLFTVDFY